MSVDPVFLPLEDWLSLDDWPVGGLLPEALSGVSLAALEGDTTAPRNQWSVSLAEDLALGLPGVDAFSLVIGSDTSGDAIFEVTLDPFAVSVSGVHLGLRVPTTCLQPVAEDGSPDTSSETMSIPLGTLSLTVDGEGNVSLGGALSVSLDCFVADTGMRITVDELEWISPATDLSTLGGPTPPAGFHGLFLKGARVLLPGLPGTGALTLDEAFFGTGGFSGSLSEPDFGLTYDESTGFAGACTGQVFGFAGGLESATITFAQNALVAFSLTGDVLIPFLDRRIGLSLGWSGAGRLTATATTPFTVDPDVVAGEGQHLLAIALGAHVTLDVDTLGFDSAASPSTIEFAGSLDLHDIPDLDDLAVDLKGLKIGADGHVAVDGGWLDVPTAVSAALHGFPLELTRVGFGIDDDLPWIGLNGGVKLADGLPVGASVKGLRLSFDSGWGFDHVALEGIAVALDVPGAFKFSASVDATADGFAGHGSLALTPLALEVDVDVAVGHLQGQTYLYLHLALELPAGIPLFQTGAAFFGFEGLVAINMGPDRHGDEPWYAGWYKRPVAGATDVGKWTAQLGTYAGGLGTTIGTAADNGFSASAKTLIVLVLPGPLLLLDGKGTFLHKRASATQPASEGEFDALLVLDCPHQLFQFNVAAAYQVDDLVDIGGEAEVAYSWADPEPPKNWHLYIGQPDPPKQIHAKVFGLFDASAYFDIGRGVVADGAANEVGIELGAHVMYGEDFDFKVVAAVAKVDIDGEGEISPRPLQFDATLTLTGTVKLAAFGAHVLISVSAGVGVKGPTPWSVDAKVSATISVNLWLKKFSKTVTLEFTWGPEGGQPSPVSPMIASFAWEHPLLDLTGTLDGAQVCGDVRPEVLFARPMTDLPALGAGVGTVPADTVGDSSFSYQLTQVLLVSTDSGDRLVAAAGVLAPDGSSASLQFPGPALPDPGGGELVLSTQTGAPSYAVTGYANGTLQLAGSLPSTGSSPYRLSGAQAQATVAIIAASAIGFGMVDVTLAADPGFGDDAFAGGSLTMGTSVYPVVGNRGATVTVTAASASGLTTAPATLAAAPGATLEGSWLANDPHTPKSTSLALSTKTPFAYFRRSDSSVVDGFDPRLYACGPTPIEAPLCVAASGLAVGPLSGTFRYERFVATAVRRVQAMPPAPATSAQALGIGLASDGHGGWRAGQQGELRVTFGPPVDEAWVHGYSVEGSLTVTADNGVSARIGGMPGVADLTGPVASIDITGSGYITEICTRPGWTCLTWDPQLFRQHASRETYGGVKLITSGRMSMSQSALLVSARAGSPDATLRMVFPRSVTRVRIGLVGVGRALGYQGARRIAEIQLRAGEPGTLSAPSGQWIDSVTVSGASPVTVLTLCTDSGELAAAREDQYAWGQSVRQSLAAYSSRDPVLAPGSYRLDVAAVCLDGSTGAQIGQTEHQPASFTVVDPPGVATPTGGPLDTLAPYVAESYPAAGERAVYRELDLAVLFEVNYVSHLYGVAAAPLTLVAVDGNGQDQRPSTVNAWGTDPEPDLGEVDTEWMKALHGDGTQRCGTIDTTTVQRNETLTAGAGELLAPSRLHAGEIHAGTSSVYRWEFTTSRFASFAQHLAAFTRRCWSVSAPAVSAPAALTTGLAAAEQALTVAGQKYASARQPLIDGVPSADQLDAYASARAALEAATAAMTDARDDAFQALWSALGLPAGRALPNAGVEVSRVGNGLLVESEEPLHAERVTVTATMAGQTPLREVVLVPDELDPGSPDAGDFRFGGLDWTTATELRVEPEPSGRPFPPVGRSRPALVPVTGGLDLSFDPAAATSVAIIVRIAPAATATVHADGTSASPDVQATAPPRLAVTRTLTVTGAPLSRVTVSGIGTSILGVRLASPLSPVTPAGPLRLRACTLAVPGQTAVEAVELMALGDVELAGYTLWWWDALAPSTPRAYYTFATYALADGQLARVYSGTGSDGRDSDGVTFYTGAATALPATGAVIQLCDPSGVVVDELAQLAASDYVAVANMITVASRDGARMLVLPGDGSSLAVGHWQLDFTYLRDAGPALPRVSVGGGTASEDARLSFLVT